MERSAPHRLFVAIGCAALAVLALAVPADAGGRNDLYSGPIEQEPVKGLPHETKVEIFVWTQHHGDGRVTRFISRINIYDVGLRCENGKYVGAGEPIGNTDVIQVNFSRKLEIKGGSFSEPKGYGSYGEAEAVAIKGSLSKRGGSGTVVITNQLGWVETEEFLEEPMREHFGTCRSGRLHWTVTRDG